MEENDNLFTDDYDELDPESCGDMISSVFKQLEEILGIKVKCYHWNENSICAAFNIKVDLPSRGTIGGIDIRQIEPIILVFNKKFYPSIAPHARSNRKDFPTTKLPHLIPVSAGQPPCLCLHRGNINDWFAEHTLSDLLKRIRGWYRDAAANRLVAENDRFEATRLTNTNGSIVFRVEDLEKFLTTNWETNGGSEDYGFLWLSLFDKKLTKLSATDNFPAQLILTCKKEDDLQVLIKVTTTINTIEEGTVSSWCFGIICHSSNKNFTRDHFGELPKTLEQLINFCNQYQFPILPALKEYKERGLQFLNGIPIILLIKRPLPLINQETYIEPLCFLLDGDDLELGDNSIEPLSADVWTLWHRFPLTTDRAADLSNSVRDDISIPILFFGCGALGSKIQLHLGRSGYTNLTLVDNDTLAPHNFVRHALLPNLSGKNKANAVREAINSVFSNTTVSNIVADQNSALEWIKGDKKQETEKFQLLVDATASSSIFETLLPCKLPNTLRVVRCEITDSGNLGLMYIEGLNRNPRLDDLQVALFDLAIDNTLLQSWLSRERDQRERLSGPALEEISIGISCASDTMRLSDDIVSLHGARCSMILKKLLNHQDRFVQGSLILNSILTRDDILFDEVIDSTFLVEPFTVLSTKDTNGWEVRIHPTVVSKMKEELIKNYPNETGGLMIGLIHSKRRVIYVTRTIDAPQGSMGDPSKFRRNSAKNSPELTAIMNKTGQTLGYIGDWHSHPISSANRSATDLNAMLETKKQLAPAGVPTFILIISQDEIKPYII